MARKIIALSDSGSLDDTAGAPILFLVRAQKPTNQVPLPFTVRANTPVYPAVGSICPVCGQVVRQDGRATLCNCGSSNTQY